ncbi:hypothetical protein FRAHR75_330007 [Frankia sp. Hr75.2]|nr:hypothetical protein FRAHR75_330007 [Frankia sp. Hr75.2]
MPVPLPLRPRTIKHESRGSRALDGIRYPGRTLGGLQVQRDIDSYGAGRGPSRPRIAVS